MASSAERDPLQGRVEIANCLRKLQKSCAFHVRPLSEWYFADTLESLATYLLPQTCFAVIFVVDIFYCKNNISGII